MEYLEKLLKKTGWSSLITSIAFAVMGIILILKPDETIKVISYVIGVLIVLLGLYKLIGYFENKEEQNDIYNYDLAYGLIAIIIGIIAIIYSTQILSIFRIIIGIWIIYSAIMRLNLSIKLKTLTSNIWIYSLVISLLMLVCGICVTFINNIQNTIIITLGVFIVIYSVLDFIESLIFLYNITKITK